MVGKKELLSKIIYFGGLALPLLAMRTYLKKEIRILAYHRVEELKNEELYPYDPDLISVTPAEFEWQMEYVKQHLNPISLSELVEYVKGKIKLPPRPIVITFDDGFDDNYRCAYPILKNKSMPATIFLSTGYMGSKETFWYDQLVYDVCSAKVLKINVAGMDIKINRNDSLEIKREKAYEILEVVKKVSNAERLKVVERIGAMCTSNRKQEEREKSLPLTWEQVKEMSHNGIEYGSHTVTHPIMSNLDANDLENELVNSKNRIEEMTGKSVETIAYPVGMPYAFNDVVINAVKKAVLGLSYIHGTNYINNPDLFSLKRLHVERYTDRAYFASMLSAPELF